MITKMRKIGNIFIVFLALIALASCQNDLEPNYQFMPNMYAPVGYETYGEYDVEGFEGGQEAKLPVEGTVPRGFQPFDYTNSPEDIARAKSDLKNPLEYTEDNLAAGAQLYNIYCAVCHGDKGDGLGILAKREKFLGIPSYAAAGREITEGGVYHVQMYGLNTMGSYASQTNEKERWQITQHVMNLKAALEGKPLMLPKKIIDNQTPQLPVGGDATATPTELEQDNIDSH
ncbi:cytochrome c family protein [unidentified eubacterium SCB49]|nr:cytochrome c family protein [unidentified eubacterium SCB49]